MHSCMDTCTCMCSSVHSCGCVVDGGDAYGGFFVCFSIHMYIRTCRWHVIESLPKGGITMSLTFWYKVSLQVNVHILLYRVRGEGKFCV